MLGVVLWSDEIDRKAVFWCEDHGDLAFFNAPDSLMTEGHFFEAGDMVEFDVTLEHRLRKARNAHLVEPQGLSGLPKNLKKCSDLGGSGGDACNGASKIVSLNPYQPTNRKRQPAPKRRAAR